MSGGVAVDDAFASTDQHVNEFYSTIREWLVFGLVYVILCSTSLGILQYFRRNKAVIRPSHAKWKLLNGRLRAAEADGMEWDRVYIPLLLTTVALAIAMAAMLLVPLTIVTRAVGYASLNEKWYFQWLSLPLVQGLWNSVFWVSNMSFFGCIPFAYFYYESIGIGGRGVMGRLTEACIVLFLVVMMFLGFLLVFNLGAESLVDISAHFRMSYSVLSLVGSLVLLLCVPLGIYKLTRWGLGLYRSKRFYAQLSDALNEHQQDLLVLERRLADAKDHHERAQVHAHKMKASQLVQQHQAMLNQPKWVRTAASFIVSTYSVCALGYMAVRVGAHVALALVLPLVSRISSHNVSYQETLVLWVLGRWSVLLDAVVDTAIIIYLMAAAMVGLYALPGLSSFLRPMANNTSMRVLMLNVSIVLLVSSSFPIAADMLGLSEVSLLGSYGAVQKYSVAFLALYRTAFIVSLAFCTRRLFPVAFSRAMLLVPFIRKEPKGEAKKGQ